MGSLVLVMGSQARTRRLTLAFRHMRVLQARHTHSVSGMRVINTASRSRAER